MQLTSRFASRSPVLRSERPLSDDQIRAVAPSIFADAPHESRSERYSYIPTATVLQELRGERSEEHTSELQSLMRISYAVFCLQQKIYHLLQSYITTLSLHI